MKHFLLKISLFSLLFLFAGCYTQLQMVDRGSDQYATGQYEEGYYYADTTANDDGNVYNYYVYGSPTDLYGYPAYYDPFGYSDWYWDIPPRWGLFVSYSSWDPYWYPWGWRGRSWYPFVSAYPWGYYGFYDYYPYYYFPGYYYGYDRDYHFKKRTFDRRQDYYGRHIERGNRAPGDQSTRVADNRRIIRRSGDTGISARGSSGNERQIIRSGESRRLLRTERGNKDSRQPATRTIRRSHRPSSDGTAVTNSRSNTRSSHSRPSFRNSARSSSRSSGYTPRSSTRRSGSSRSAVRSSSGHRSSSSGSSSHSSSRSSSGSSHRSAKRR
ncbi:MAG: hypothetical protein P8184_13405 [Calditrichia bacterium]